MQVSALEAAKKYVEQYHPTCLLAVLGGSGSRDQLNPHSDLDLVILDDDAEEPYRKTSQFGAWLVECFIITSMDYRSLFDEGIMSANPALQRMLVEGIELYCDKVAEKLICEAKRDLEYGPMSWTESEIDHARYTLTELIHDLQGSQERTESWFIANRLVTLLAEFHLRVHRQWIGEGKHLYRQLNSFDSEIASRLEVALETFYSHHRPDPLISLCLDTLTPYGGPLLDGFVQ